MEDLETIDAIRKRPGMYIGDTRDGSGLNHMLLEVLGNCLDQYFAGKLTRIDVALTSDGGIRVSDDGEGISTEQDESGLSFLERVFTQFHTTPTADGHAPHIHLSTHGLGLCVVCALSRRLVVTTGNAPRVRQEFARGKALGPAVEVDSEEAGTCVEWVPDTEIFSGVSWNPTKIERKLRDLTHLAPGLTMSLQMAPQTWGPVTDLRPLVRDLLDCRAVLCEAILCTAEDGPMSASAAIVWCDVPDYFTELDYHVERDHYAPQTVSFCNLQRTHDGGSHVNGFMRGVRDVLRKTFDVIDEEELEKLTRGIRAVVSVDLIDPSYLSPTKDLLNHEGAHSLARRAVTGHLGQALASDPGLLEALAKRLADKANAPD